LIGFIAVIGAVAIGVNRIGVGIKKLLVKVAKSIVIKIGFSRRSDGAAKPSLPGEKIAAIDIAVVAESP